MMTMYAQDPRRACEHCFANNYLWQSVYPAEMAEFDGCISVRFYDGADLYYDFPSGPGDKQQALERILEWTKRQDALRFYGLLRDEVELLEKWHPGEFIITPERDIYDYIYETGRLTTLAGKKLHGKRGHIHRFEENHDWRYESLGPDNWQGLSEDESNLEAQAC